MLSLQTRLGAGLLISLLSVFLILWLVVSGAIRSLAENQIALRLQHDSEALLAIIEFDPQGQPILSKKYHDLIYQQPFSGHYFKILGAQTEIRSRSLWDQDLPVSAQSPGNKDRTHRIGPQRQPLLVLTIGYVKQQHAISIAVAEDLSPIESEIAQFQRRFTVIALLTLTLLTGLQAVMIRTALRPLNKVRNELSLLERAELRSLNDKVPVEISPLVTEINHLITIMNQRLLRSRNALADLAHALKKPLTVLRQLAHTSTVTEPTEIRQALDAQTLSMQRIMNRVLKRARLAGEGPTGAYFPVQKELPALLEALRAMYRDKPLRITTALDEDLALPFDREDLLELLGNLIENACKWAREKIHISISANGQARIVIEDDGPGVDIENTTTLLRRGMRLDERVEGHGMGLAIAQEIVSQYHGEIALGRSEALGGFKVELTLPLGKTG